MSSTVRSCAVAGCRSSSERPKDRLVSYHKLPKDPALRDEWIEIARLREADHKSCLVCSRHFRKVDYSKAVSKFILKSDAVPSIFPWGSSKPIAVDAVTSSTKDEDLKRNGRVDTPDAPDDDKPDSKTKESPVKEPPPKTEEKSSPQKMDTDELPPIQDAPSRDAAPKTEESIEEIASYLDEENRKFELATATAPDPSPRPKIPDDMSSAPEIESIFENMLEKANNASKKDDSDSQGESPGRKSDTTPTEGDVKAAPEPKAKAGTPGRPRRSAILKQKKTPTKTKAAKRKSLPVANSNAPEKISGPFIRSSKGTFVQGSRVEAKDFSDCWYLAKVLEVDNEEEEVLIHYDKWSQRYDEWINIHSPRLRFVESPPAAEENSVPTYVVGERCFARWTNNQRFPATVKKVLSNGKYEVMFDDGFVRTMRWVMMSKSLNRRTSTAAPASPGPLSPVPYGTRHDGSAPVVPSAPPPPVHNHLFDPKCDHLGTKEERRNMKKKIDVKSLFFRKRKNEDNEEELNSNATEEKPKSKKIKQEIAITEKVRKKPGPKKIATKQEQDARGKQEIPPKDISVKQEPTIKQETLPKQESSSKHVTPTAKTSNVSKVSNIASPVASPVTSSATSATGIKSPISKQAEALNSNMSPKSQNMTHSPSTLQDSKKLLHDKLMSKPSQSKANHSFPNFSENSPLKTLLTAGSDRFKQHDIKFSPGSSFSSIKSETKGTPQHGKLNTQAMASEASDDSKSIMDTSFSSANSSMTNDTSMQLGMSSSHLQQYKFHSTPKSVINPHLVNSPFKKSKYNLNDPFNHIRAAEKDWYCRWVNNAPVGTFIESDSSKDPRQTVQVEDVRLPPQWTKLITRKLSPCGNDGKWEVILICPSGRRYRNRKEMCERLKEDDYPELSKYLNGLLDFSAHRKQARRCGCDVIKPEPAPVTPQVTFEVVPNNNSSIPGMTPDPSNPGQHFTFIGSLKVQIFDNLLRCPQDRCFKNFRKVNLLQMHVKHYHPELCKFFGDTPNVADLAYARTVVEEPTVPPIKIRIESSDKSFHRSRDRRSESYSIKQEPDCITYKTEAPDLDYEPHDQTSHPSHQMRINSNNFYGGRLATDTDFGQSSKHEEGAVKVEDSLYSHWNFNKLKSPNRSSNSFHQSNDGDYHSIDMYKKKSKKSDHKSKKKNYDAWNNFSPAFDETRSSFGVSDKNTENATSNYIVSDDIKNEAKSNDEKDETNQSTIVTETGERIKIVHMKREEIINCHCGFGEEDGLMIQCELCLCWQHALCNRIERESEVPVKYICYTCLNPLRGRRSQKYLNDQDWLYDGKLPRSSANAELLVDQPRTDMLRQSHELTANLLQLKELMHSLRCKIEVAEKKDHPKLYLWAKPWKDNVIENTVNMVEFSTGMKEETVETSQVVETEIPMEIETDNAKPDETSNTSELIQNKSELIENTPELIQNTSELVENTPELIQNTTEEVQCTEEQIPAEQIPCAAEENPCTAEESQLIKEENPTPAESNQTLTDQNQSTGETDANATEQDPTSLENLSNENAMEIDTSIVTESDPQNQSLELLAPTISDTELLNQSDDLLKEKKVDLVNGSSQSPFANLFASPGGTSLDLPITHSDLEALTQNVVPTAVLPPVLAPQPEAAIEPSECRTRLYQHIEATQMNLDARLDFIESKIAELESQGPSVIDDETADSYPRTKQTIQMLRRDLGILEELGSIC